MADDLRAALATGRVLLLDGAMGTELQRAGLAAGECGERWNTSHPERIRAIHASYRDAGCAILSTNTFGANAFRLRGHGLAGQVGALCRAGAELAREASGTAGWVLGDLGPFGGLLAPLGEATPDAVSAAFHEQTQALLDAGVDGILIETMQAIEEMQLAVAAARAAGADLVAASFAFDRKRNGRLHTAMGVTPEAAVAAMLAAGVDVVGCNCGTDLGRDDVVSIVRSFRAASALPILVQPNAGQPESTPSGVRYDMTPARFGSGMVAAQAAGANLLGGCCGTTPAHLAALRRSLPGAAG